MLPPPQPKARRHSASKYDFVKVGHSLQASCLRGLVGKKLFCLPSSPDLPLPGAKVKVWLGENQDHYYVLSRFLISRMLTVTMIPYLKVWRVPLVFHARNASFLCIFKEWVLSSGRQDSTRSQEVSSGQQLI